MIESKPHALITGASEGIGREFALQLASKGYVVTAVARNRERLESLVTTLQGSGHRYISCDLSSAQGIGEIAKELTERRYSLLVNNAGFGWLGEFAKQPLSNIREMMTLNMVAPVELTRAFLQKAERGDGVIQVSSTLSILPMPQQAVYSATKAFLTSWSESIWYQLRLKGVVILNLCPGSTDTLFPVRSGGNRKNIPRAITESPEQVVRTALEAYERKAGPTVLSGAFNRWATLLARLMTRKFAVKMMGRIRQ